MTPEQEALLHQTLNEMKELKQQVSHFNKSIAYRSPNLSGKEKGKSLEAKIMASIVSKGKTNQKHN